MFHPIWGELAISWIVQTTWTLWIFLGNPLQTAFQGTGPLCLWLLVEAETAAASVSSQEKNWVFTSWVLVSSGFAPFVCSFVWFFLVFPFVWVRKDRGFCVGRGWRQRKGLFCTKPPPEQLCWLLYPSSESLLEPQTEALFCLESASLAPSPANTCFYAPKSWETLCCPPGWHRPCWEGCTQGMVTLGSRGGVWGHAMEHGPEPALLMGQSSLTGKKKSILCPEAGTDHSAGAHIIVLT